MHEIAIAKANASGSITCDGGEDGLDGDSLGCGGGDGSGGGGGDGSGGNGLGGGGGDGSGGNGLGGGGGDGSGPGGGKDIGSTNVSQRHSNGCPNFS